MTGLLLPPPRLTWQAPPPAEIRAELTRRAAGIVPRPAHYIEDFEPPDGECRDFCEPCARAAAGRLRVRREPNADSDFIRCCETCGALLDYRVMPEDVEEEIERWEEKPPRAASDWAELLQAMAEVEPADVWEPGDPPVEPSPLWARVAALLTPRTPCTVPREPRPCEVQPATAADMRRGRKLVAALFGMAAAVGVDIAPPPRRGR